MFLEELETCCRTLRRHLARVFCWVPPSPPEEPDGPEEGPVSAPPSSDPRPFRQVNGAAADPDWDIL